MDNDLINISPYQMFLLHIRSPKTRLQYTQKFEHFFKFLSQQLGEKEFETKDIEKKYLLLYQKAKSKSWLFNCLLRYVHFINRRVETENISGATFYNYFKNIKKFCLANDIEVKWHKLFLSAPKKRRAAIDRPPTIPEIKIILEYPDRRIRLIVFLLYTMRIKFGEPSIKHGLVIL